MYSDYQGVVEARAQGNLAPRGGTRAGVARSAAVERGCKAIEHVFKVRARVDPSICSNPHDEWLARCNGHADAEAKPGASFHLQPGPVTVVKWT